MAVNTATAMARKVVMVLMAQLLVVVTAGLFGQDPLLLGGCAAPSGDLEPRRGAPPRGEGHSTDGALHH